MLRLFGVIILLFLAITLTACELLRVEPTATNTPISVFSSPAPHPIATVTSSALSTLEPTDIRWPSDATTTPATTKPSPVAIAVQGFSGKTKTPVPTPYFLYGNLATLVPSVAISAFQNVQGIPTPRQVLEALYGNVAISISDTKALLPGPMPGYTTTVQINLMACYWEDGVEKCLVITNSAFDYSHVSQADIGGAVLKRINGVWHIAIFQPYITSMGSFGYVPKGYLIQIGPGKYAALLRGEWAGQGYEGEGCAIIAEIDGALRVILSLPLSAVQEGEYNKLEWGYGSRLDFYEGRSPIYSLKVTQFGINEKRQKFKKISVYTFSQTEHRYVLFKEIEK
jgi:hypothetical protein